MEKVKIVKYKPGYQKHFERLNRAWVEKYFEIEPQDEAQLSNPDDNILKNGGQLLFAEHQGRIIGTVALIVIKDGVYEMAKMTVDEAFQGMGVGKFLCNAAIEEAKRLNADKLILFTNSKLKTAIHIYHTAGFKDVELGGQQFSRADIKMELLLKAETTGKWFDRKFDFNFGVERFEDLLSRLAEFPAMLKQKLDALPEELLTRHKAGKWSINENVGHLFSLEKLWRNRFREINEGKPQMSPADLTNAATQNASFNNYPVTELTACFDDERTKTIEFLKQLSSSDLIKSSVHPRLNQPMRMIDLMHFVAEHDQHHWNSIQAIINEN